MFLFGFPILIFYQRFFLFFLLIILFISFGSHAFPCDSYFVFLFVFLSFQSHVIPCNSLFEFFLFILYTHSLSFNYLNKFCFKSSCYELLLFTRSQVHMFRVQEFTAASALPSSSQSTLHIKPSMKFQSCLAS